MNLSLQFICSQLNYDITVVNAVDNLKYSGIGIYSSSIKIEPDTLYMCLNGTSSISSGDEKDSCKGIVWMEEENLPEQIPAIWIHGERDSVKVFDEILGIFRKFHLWSEEISSAIFGKEPLEEIMQLLNQVTPNPWYLTDNCFRTCVIKDDPLFMDISASWRYQYNHKHMAFATIYKLISSGDMTKINCAERAVIFYKTEAFHMPFVSRTIFSSKGVIGHFFIIGLHNNLSCYELEIADYFCDAVSMLIDYNEDNTVAARGFYDFFFIDLIEENELNAIEMEMMLKTLNWRLDDEYIACAMVIPSFQQVQNTLNTITVYEIEEMMPCKAFLYGDKLIYIINKTHLTRKRQKDIPVMQYLVEKLKVIAGKYGGSIGYSDSFKGMEKLSVHYHQAVLAAEYASNAASPVDLLAYTSVCVPHMLKGALKSLSKDYVLHPAVYLLEEYDRKNHTEFLKTLYIYLKNERRTYETVKELYIHRNSLLYRLERIDEITGFQMDDYNERLRMLISCYIYFQL